ncbi:hypothetical protein KI688_002891 [Linnemannia hyalina]|uniref:Uncharacterized protein n=1 Tax=Linnemannia hyalina TaxID=64524 RepID=A0A9P7XQZ1_9FUNG|nr:hypothetical protein KI688_002891 [Linnemannia hyalina]
MNKHQTRYISNLIEKLCIDVHSISFSTAEISDLQFQDYLDVTGSKNLVFSLKELSIPINLHWHELDAIFRFLGYTP